MKRFMSASVLLLVLCFVLVSLQGIRPVEATIYINTFGVIVPSSAPIQRNGNVYTFTADINDAIEIQADNIVVDGASHTVQGAGIGEGIIVGNVGDLPTVYNVTLKNLKINTFGGGILLRNCLNCSISEVNIALVSNEGIEIYRSSNNIVVQNHIGAQTAGVRLDQAYDNTISRNNVTNSYDSIEIWGSSNNSVVENNITNNNWGIRLADSSNNKIYHNNLLNNTHQVYLENEGKDIWDDGFPSGGNHWSDYEEKYPNATEIDHSGIWNTPYVVDSDNKDNYPLVPEFSSTIILLLFMMVSILYVITIRHKYRRRTLEAEGQMVHSK